MPYFTDPQLKSSPAPACRTDLLQLQEPTVDPAFFRGVAYFEILLPEELGFADDVDPGAVCDGAGHRGTAGHDTARTAPELDAGADPGCGHAEIACRYPGSPPDACGSPGRGRPDYRGRSCSRRSRGPHGGRVLAPTCRGRCDHKHQKAKGNSLSHASRSRGSSASRSPSPARLNPSTAIIMAIPG
jgi:hypothetical protein